MKHANTFSIAAASALMALGVAAQSISSPKERLLSREDITPFQPFEGVRSLRIYTDALSITLGIMEAGASSIHHNHPYEQTMLFETGVGLAYVGENEYHIGSGDILVIPAYIPHHFEAIERLTYTEVHGPGFDNSAKWQNQ